MEMAVGWSRLGFKPSATNFIFKHPRLAARLAEIAGKPIVSGTLPSQAPSAPLAEATAPPQSACRG